MLGWLRDRRRKKLLEAPFPKAWRQILGRNVAHYARLSEREKRRLRELVQVFVAEKTWEGCGGLVLDDEIRVTIAAEACLLILALPHDLYADVQTILVYPSSVIAPERKLGVFEVARQPLPGSQEIDGQAHARGPVILAWDSARHSARHPECGHNVVYHEFAHKLDMLDGRSNGTPPLGGPAQYRRWAEVCGREFAALRASAERGQPTFIDDYGATNEAEFFAVATEHFFDEPLGMKEFHAELYEAFREFYNQDPAARERRRLTSRKPSASRRRPGRTSSRRSRRA